MSLSWYHPLLSCVDSVAYERAYFAQDETSELEALQKAGNGLGSMLTEDLYRYLSSDLPILLILGKGNNAGDAMIATQCLVKQFPRLRVWVFPLMGTKPFREEILPFFDRLMECSRVNSVSSIDDLEALGLEFSVSIDGVFGMQFRLPIASHLSDCFERINRLRIQARVAVDLPSGLFDHASNVVLRADFTYGTGILKSPVVRPENRRNCGRVRYVDIGFFDSFRGACSGSEYVLSSSCLQRVESLRDVASDKRSYGHLLVVAGSRQMPGAMLMAVGSALRSGVGLVSVVAPESVCAVAAVQYPEAMWIPWKESDSGGLDCASLESLLPVLSRATAVLMGPGIGKEASSQLLMDRILEHVDVPVVLDADALQMERVYALSQGEKVTVMTPHEGELRRILNVDIAGVLSGMRLLGRFGLSESMILVRKGPLTTIEQDGCSYYSPYGGPVLARGGSGDLLAGLIAGMVANPHFSNLIEAVASGVTAHGRAADRLASFKGENFVQTTQILEYLS